MINKTPFVKLTVGAQYVAPNTPDAGLDYNPDTYSGVVKQETVDNIGTTENLETSLVPASGKIYTTISQTSSFELGVDVVAFDPELLAQLRGDVVDEGGLNTAGRSVKKPFFAYGYVEKYQGGHKFIWLPKCQLVENSQDVATSGETFSQQNDTLTIRAYAFNGNGDIKNYVDSQMSNYPAGLTEEQFFAAPIVTKEDLADVLNPGA